MCIRDSYFPLAHNFFTTWINVVPMNFKVSIKCLRVIRLWRNFYQISIKQYPQSGKIFKTLRRILPHFWAYTPKFSKKVKNLIFNSILDFKVQIDYEKIGFGWNASNSFKYRLWSSTESLAKVKKPTLNLCSMQIMFKNKNRFSREKCIF